MSTTTKTVTVTKEYDEDGKLVKETSEEVTNTVDNTYSPNCTRQHYPTYYPPQYHGWQQVFSTASTGLQSAVS